MRKETKFCDICGCEIDNQDMSEMELSVTREERVASSDQVTDIEDVTVQFIAKDVCNDCCDNFVTYIKDQIGSRDKVHKELSKDHIQEVTLIY